MTDWIASIVGAQSAPMVSLALIGLAGLVGLVLLYWLIRRLSHGTFINGGRSALPRLAVQDAAPVDSHRRLVLVRRDDVEHLLLIGGNTDIVVEQNIRQASAAQRGTPEAAVRERPPATAQQSRQLPPLQSAPQRAAAMPPPARPAQFSEQRLESRLEPHMPPLGARSEPSAMPSAPSRFEQRPTAEQREKPLPPNFTQIAERPAARAEEPNLDDELSKMMGEFDVFSQPKQ